MQAIVCVDKNWGIGKNNNLLFRLPKDMAYFREKTLRKIVVMGRNTFLSLPDHLPLKDRRNFVLRHNGNESDAEKYGYTLARSIDELLPTLSKYNPDDVFVIGGAMLYETLLPYCTKAFVTKVNTDGNADRFFPNLDSLANWHLESIGPVIIDGGLPIRFSVYSNTNPLKF